MFGYDFFALKKIVFLKSCSCTEPESVGKGVAIILDATRSYGNVVLGSLEIKELAVGAGSAEEETVEAFWWVKTVITGGEVV